MSWLRIRSEEELHKTDFTNVKILIVAGSFDSDIDPRPFVRKSLKPIYDSYPGLKFFGFGAGATLLATLSGIKVEYSSSDKQGLTFLGRRQLSLPEVGPTVLQYVRGAWKLTTCEDPTTLDLITSDDFGIEGFATKDKRILANIAHPDYNRAFMQEQVISEYFKKHLITPDFNY